MIRLTHSRAVEEAPSYRLPSPDDLTPSGDDLFTHSGDDHTFGRRSRYFRVTFLTRSGDTCTHLRAIKFTRSGDDFAAK